MYATAQPFASFAGHAARQALGGLYQQVRVESKVDGASPHELVAMLFEGFMEAVAQARGAMREQRPEIKGLAIGRAVRIVEEGLRGGLDLRAGGSLARDLDELYGYLAMRLTLANLRNDEAALEECQRLMRPLHEAWLAIAEEAEARPAALPRRS
ncbi:MAG: flagellar export chaperone FliS [Burkholderiales bacterium]|nr:flagellar export chaperone FliS [Burkholderiales bacterium]